MTLFMPLNLKLLFADDTNLHLSHSDNDIDSLQTQAEHETMKINNGVNITKLNINIILHQTGYVSTIK